MALAKRELAALEKVFAAEVAGRIPFQSKAKVYADLAEAGYLQPDSRTFGAGSRFPVIVAGYALTHWGRYTYCASCGTEEGEDGTDSAP